jgi:RecB family exonuclease
MNTLNDITKLIEVRPDAVVVDESASPSILSKALLPSTLNAMNECHARYAVDKLLSHFVTASAPATTPQKIGQSVHSVLEKLMLSTTRSTGKIEWILSRLIASGDIEYPTDDAEFEAWSLTVLNLANNLFQIEDPTTVEVVGVEKRVQLEMWGVPINGFVDRIDRVEDGLRIVDYKTGKVPRSYEDFERQLVIYAEAVRELYQEPVVGASDYFLAKGVTHSVAISPARVSLTRRAVKEAWTTVESLRASMRFEYKTSPLCGWCPLVTQCPAAKAQGFEARTPEAEILSGLDLQEFNSQTTQPLYNQEETTDMESTRYSEDKKWVPLLADGSVNLGSYEADNANRVAALAMWVATARCDGSPKNSELLNLSRLFTYVIGEAARQAVNASNPIGMGTSLWTTAFYTFNTWHTTNPVDFRDPQGWSDEAIEATKRVIQLTRRILIDSYEDTDFDVEAVEFGENRWS